MASRIGEIDQICRFCLSYEPFMALSKAVSSAFTLADVEHCTGIQISKAEHLLYAICNHCFRAINNSVCFRRTCMKNDSVFKTLISVLNVKENGEAAETPQTNDPTSSTQLSELADDAGSNPIITLSESDSDDAISFHSVDFLQEDLNELLLTGRKRRSTIAIGEDEDMDAASNSDYSVASLYGEVMAEARDGSDSDYSVASLYGEAMAEAAKKKLPTTHESSVTTDKTNSSTQQGAKKKFSEKQLCWICGTLINGPNFTSHMKRTHYKEKNFSCPYCPKKMNQNCELKDHINTWHEKRIKYTCQYCGRGFTNHSAHSYHMSNSHGKSDVYECKTCHKKLKSWDGYKKHLKEHSITAIPCKDCGKLYKNNATLEFHRLHYHPSDP